METLQENKQGVEQRSSALFFEKNMPLVYYVYNKKYKQGFQRYEDDLIQSGMLELWRACRTYDKSKNVRFGSYAVRCICNEMNYFLRKELKHYLNTTGYGVLDNEGKKVNILDITADEKQDFQEELNMKLFLQKSKLVSEYANGKSMRNIGQDIGKSRQQVYNLITKEREELKNRIK